MAVCGVTISLLLSHTEILLHVISGTGPATCTRPNTAHPCLRRTAYGSSTSPGITSKGCNAGGLLLLRRIRTSMSGCRAGISIHRRCSQCFPIVGDVICRVLAGILSLVYACGSSTPFCPLASGKDCLLIACSWGILAEACVARDFHQSLHSTLGLFAHRKAYDVDRLSSV